MKNVSTAELRTIPLVTVALLAGSAFNDAVAQDEDDACADLYLVNGRFFSMAELPQTADGVAQSDFNSMRIASNVIAAVGDDLEAPACARTIDLDGRTVIPGLSDTHMHFIRATLRPGYDTRELELSRSIPEAMDMIAAKSAAMAEAEVPTDQWITFIGGWDPIQWDENPVGSGPGGGPAFVFPTLEQMDAAAGGYPFYIHLRSTETAYTNTPGMDRLNELAAMTAGAGDPQIDSDTGFVADSTAAFVLIKQDSDPRDQAIRVMRGFNSVGLTSVVDVGGSIRGMGAQYFNVFSDYETMKALYDADELTIRVRARVQGDLITPVADYEALVHSIAARFGSEDDSMFKVIGLGEDLGDIATNGYQNVVEMAISNGWQVGKHAGQLADIETYRAAAVATGNVTRLTLEHSSPGEAEFDAIKALGYEDVVGINLSSHAFLGRGAAGRVCDSVRFRSVVEQGLHAGIGTDSTNAQPSNPWINIYAMVTGKDVKGFGLRAGGVTTLRAIGAGGMGGMAGMGGAGAMGAAGAGSNAGGARAGTAVDLDAPVTCPDERISRAQAVQLHTRGSAWLAGSEDDYGTLEEGKLADLVVLSDDIFSASVSDDEIQGIHSQMTIVDGEIVYVGEDAGFIFQIDE